MGFESFESEEACRDVRRVDLDWTRAERGFGLL
jgi:hypothetical protein